MSSQIRMPANAALAALDMAAWFDQVEELADDLGSYNFLGKDHASAFIEAGPKLLVTFEHVPTIMADHVEAEPAGFHYVRHHGWSHLGIYTSRDTWFRDPYVYAYFDRLIDDGFFDGFDDVLFYGVGAGAYAAAAYSVASPGCNVLALRPQATLDPKITGFDPRYKRQRRLDFTSRYGYAPDMIDAANRAYIAFDPHQVLDAVHAALFTKPNVTALRCTGLGKQLDQAFNAMGIADPIMRAAMAGTLTPASFGKYLRAHRGYLPYLRMLYTLMMKRNRPRMAAQVCAYARQHGSDPFFSDNLAKLEAQGHAPFRCDAIRAAE